MSCGTSFTSLEILDLCRTGFDRKFNYDYEDKFLTKHMLLMKRPIAIKTHCTKIPMFGIKENVTYFLARFIFFFLIRNVFKFYEIAK